MKNKCNASCLAALSVLMVISPLNMKASGNEWTSTNGEWKYKEGDSYKTGWFADQKCWYYADYQTGILKKGWIASGDAWYYLNPVNAIMQESRWVDDGKYYIGNNGAMATDTVIDGKEILADGTYVPFSDSKSVVLKNAEDLAGKVIEGNLYITEEAAKDLVLSDVIVKGKIVIEGSNFITLNNVTASEIKNNKAETTINFEGKTQVDKVTVTRSTSLMTDDQYKGTIKEIAIQSTTKTETIVNVKANEVTSTTYAPTTINQEVGKVTLKQESSVQLNANVEELVVQASAGHSKVDVAKDVTVAKATISSESTLGGEGTITKLEAKVDNIKVDTKVNEIVVADGVKNPPTTTDNVVAKPEESKPSGGVGGGGTGGGGSAGGDTDKEVKVTTIEGLETALENSSNISIPKGAKIELSKNLTLDSGKTLTIEDGGELSLSAELTVNGELKTYGNITSTIKEEIGGRSAFATSKTLRLNINQGRVKALNGSVFKFDNINQIASSEESFAIDENSSIIIGDKHIIGDSDAIIKLEKIQGVNDKKPLAYYFVNGDGTVILAVNGKATISTVKNALDFSVIAEDNSIINFLSSVDMKEYDHLSTRRGMINGNYSAKLYIDGKYTIGSELDNEKAVFTGKGDGQGSISFFVFNKKLIGGIRGNTTINNAIEDFLYLCPFRDMTSKATMVTNKSEEPVNLYTLNDDKFDNPTILEKEKQMVSVEEDSGKTSWKEPLFEITDFLVDVEPTTGEYLHIITNPAYADYTVKWTVDGQLKAQSPTYFVGKDDKEIVVDLIGEEGFTYKHGSKTINVTSDASTTEESLYFKHIGGVKDIKIGENQITYTGKYGDFRLAREQNLSIATNGKLSLGSKSSFARLTQIGTLDLVSNQNIEIINGEYELKSTAVVKIGGNEIIGRNGSKIKFLNKEAGIDKVAMSFVKKTDSGEGIIYIYDKIDMTQSTYDELSNKYVINVMEDGELLVAGSPITPDQTRKVTSVDELKTELLKSSNKTIVLEFSENKKINENITITNRNVEIMGDLNFEGMGNISLIGEASITLKPTANIKMPNFFILENQGDNAILADKGCSLKVGENQLLGTEEALLTILDDKSITFSNNDTLTLTLIYGNVDVSNYYSSPIIVREGGNVNLKFEKSENNAIVTSMGGSISIDGSVLLGTNGLIKPEEMLGSEKNIIQIKGKEINLHRNITLMGGLPKGLKISSKFNEETYTVNVEVGGVIPASTLDLNVEEFLLKGTYKVVDGKWTLQPKEPIKNEESIVNNEIEGSNESLLTE